MLNQTILNYLLHFDSLTCSKVTKIDKAMKIRLNYGRGLIWNLAGASLCSTEHGYTSGVSSSLPTRGAFWFWPRPCHPTNLEKRGNAQRIRISGLLNGPLPPPHPPDCLPTRGWRPVEWREALSSHQHPYLCGFQSSFLFCPQTQLPLKVISKWLRLWYFQIGVLKKLFILN